jgi:hypothetical protein
MGVAGRKVTANQQKEGSLGNEKNGGHNKLTSQLLISIKQNPSFII